MAPDESAMKYVRGMLKVGTCMAPGCHNLLPPRTSRGHPPVTCSPECKRARQVEQARVARELERTRKLNTVRCDCGLLEKDCTEYMHRPLSNP